jgi:hypothetical protein
MVHFDTRTGPTHGLQKLVRIIMVFLGQLFLIDNLPGVSVSVKIYKKFHLESPEGSID